jgi:hypothetical protein
VHRRRRDQPCGDRWDCGAESEAVPGEIALFTVVLPEDNIFGATPDVIPELTLSPSVDEGFYLYLTPRQPGEHTIRWQASSAACGTAQDVTYHLTVK